MSRARAGLVGAAALAATLQATATPETCSARSGPTPPTIVELYTSEGCSSCPPADRWLAGLKDGPATVALAFHVNYWDGLGWRDRFAAPEFTQRQRALMAASGSRVIYTPQVLVNGKDWRSWPALPRPSAAAAPTLMLRREGDAVTADIGAGAGRLAGYWAWIEDGHASQVRAGENAGNLLRHDHVVRRYEALPPWDAAAPRQWRWAWPAGSTRPARVVLVLTDAATQRPVQAVALGC